MRGRGKIMQISKVDIFHGTDLSEVVTQAQEGCPTGYEVVDLDVKFLNNLWVVISKIDREKERGE